MPSSRIAVLIYIKLAHRYQARVAIIYYGELWFPKLEPHLGCCLRYLRRLERDNTHLTAIIYGIIVRDEHDMVPLFSSCWRVRSWDASCIPRDNRGKFTRDNRNLADRRQLARTLRVKTSGGNYSPSNFCGGAKSTRADDAGVREKEPNGEQREN